MEALIESAKVAVLIAGGLLALAGVAALGDRLTHDRSAPRTVAPDDGLDLALARDFFSPTGRMSTAVAIARSTKEMAPARVTSPGATTSKEFPHAGRHQ